MKLYPVTLNEFRAAWLGYTECDQPRPFSFRLLEMAAGWIVLASYAGQDHCLSNDKGRHRNMPLARAPTFPGGCPLPCPPFPGSLQPRQVLLAWRTVSHWRNSTTSPSFLGAVQHPFPVAMIHSSDSATKQDPTLTASAVLGKNSHRN